MDVICCNNNQTIIYVIFVLRLKHELETEKEKFNQMVAKYQADLQNLQVRTLFIDHYLVVLYNIRSADSFKIPGRSSKSTGKNIIHRSVGSLV